MEKLAGRNEQAGGDRGFLGARQKGASLNIF
jgi:hypothetical protein